MSKVNKSKPLDELELSVKTYNCLSRAGVNTIDDLTRMTASDMMRVRNLGRRSLEEVISKMELMGYKLREE